VVCHSKQTGKHTHGDATVDIYSLAAKLYKDGMTVVKEDPDPDAFDAPDIREDGQKKLLAMLPDWNQVNPVPEDLVQSLAIGYGVETGIEGGVDDGIRDITENGDFWNNMVFDDDGVVRGEQ